MSPLPPAILLMGPTASGKTGLALQLARRLPCEIISVDSALVYRGMDIGTAKPDKATLAEFPHFLVDIIDPTESYSAARFCEDALGLMAEITARGHIPLLVGGTMLYFKALREGLDELPQAAPALRAEMEARAAKEGWPALHAELARLDPATADRLEAADAQRIQRALEVCLVTGRPMSEVLGRRRENFPYRAIALALAPSERAELHRRIALRFDAMLAQGFIEEVAELRRRYPLNAALPSMRCVGYRQAWQYLEGEMDFAAMREKGIAATRQLAKRQLTWLRSMPEVRNFDALSPEMETDVLAYVESELNQLEG